MTDDRDDPKTAEEAIRYLQRQFGKDSVKLMNTPPEFILVIPTGSLALDYALGVGGIPRGKITEIAGNEAAGKTTLAQMICAEAQRAGGKALYVDMEHEVHLGYMQACGVDTDALIFSQPDSGTDAWQVVSTMVPFVDVIIVDSVASLVTPAELDGIPSDQHVGVLPRMMSYNLKRIKGRLSRHGTALVFTNQFREKIGVGPHQNPETTTGGRALKFYANVRMELRRGSPIGSANDRIGHQVNIYIIKNKVAPPFQRATFDIIYGKGPRRETETLDFAAQLGIVEKRGTSHYYYKGEKLANGREAAAQVLTEKPELFNELRQAVTEALAKDTDVSITTPTDDTESVEEDVQGQLDFEGPK